MAQKNTCKNGCQNARSSLLQSMPCFKCSSESNESPVDPTALQTLFSQQIPWSFGGNIQLDSDVPGQGAISAKTTWNNYQFIFPADVSPTPSDPNPDIYVGEQGRVNDARSYTYIRPVTSPGGVTQTPKPALYTEVRFYDDGAITIGSDPVSSAPVFEINQAGDVKLGGVTVNIFDLATRLAALESA